MNTKTPNAALFDSYNARFMEPRAVAKSFIMPSSPFKLLCKDEHSLLIGPRGSGKTTLLKMLRPSALKEWHHEEQQLIAKGMPFTAVYIAADSNWNYRMVLFPRDSVEYRIFEILQNATFVTYSMMSMLESVVECRAIDASDETFGRFGFELNSNREGELASELAKRWQLELPFSSLRAASLSLQDRIQLIDGIYFEIAELGRKLKPSDLAKYEFLSISLLNGIQSFVATINELSEQRDRKWAFCFDETEILYPGYQSSLIRSLRSTRDQRLRFKISTSPFSRVPFEQSDPSIPMGGHDFTPISLSYARKHEAMRFSRQLLNGLMHEAGVDDSAVSIFGRSEFEQELPVSIRRGPQRYAPGGNRFNSLQSLSQDDPAFAKYLRRRRIDLTTIANRPETERAEIRKLIQIAQIRREFGMSNVLKQPTKEIIRHRSRKRVSDLYTGTESLLTLCEGNPRWLIGMFRPLLDENRGRPVTKSRQARSVSATIARFLSLLSTIPFSSDDHRALPVTKMIDQIGEHFFHDITSQTFKTEPDLSFVVDSRLSDEEVDAVGAALNQGAFVFIPSQENEHCAGTIRHKRFRLSYLLCPRYKLPLMFGQPVVLSRILHRTNLRGQGQYTLDDLFR